MLRCSMSPAIREQQDEFNVITNAEGKMLVGQFGSFIGQFLQIWNHKLDKGEVDQIEEGDVFITNGENLTLGLVLLNTTDNGSQMSMKYKALLVISMM